MYIVYIIAFVLDLLLYYVVRNIYIYDESCYDGRGYRKELKTDAIPTRVKYPLIAWIATGISFFVPILNIVIPIVLLIVSIVWLNIDENDNLSFNSKFWNKLITKY